MVRSRREGRTPIDSREWYGHTTDVVVICQQSIEVVDTMTMITILPSFRYYLVIRQGDRKQIRLSQLSIVPIYPPPISQFYNPAGGSHRESRTQQTQLITEVYCLVQLYEPSLSSLSSLYRVSLRDPCHCRGCLCYWFCLPNYFSFFPLLTRRDTSM